MPSHSASNPFQIALRVDAADIEEMDHVNNTVYLRWVQDAATAHWRSVASAEEWRAILWVVLRHEIDYKTPARLGDDVLVQTWVGKANGLTFERFTRIVRSGDGQLFAQARTLWVPVSARTGRPARIGAALRAELSADEAEAEETE